MSERVIVTLHLPLDMGAVARICKAVARDYPDAVVSQETGGFDIKADPDIPMSERIRIGRERREALRR